MEIKGKIEVSKEEILLQFKPEELLEYVKKNYPTVMKTQIEEEYYSLRDWFYIHSTKEYYFLTEINPKVYTLSRHWHDGSLVVYDYGFTMKADEKFRIPKSELDKYGRRYDRVDFDRIPIDRIIPWVKK